MMIFHWFFFCYCSNVVKDQSVKKKVEKQLKWIEQCMVK